MPTYEYEAVDPARSCPQCAAGFEVVQSFRDAPLTVCTACSAPVRKRISAPAIGRSKSTLDQRAKAVGFQKLKRVGKGEYEKMY
jgi:putative FmdB family regulatory protein